MKTIYLDDYDEQMEDIIVFSLNSKYSTFFHRLDDAKLYYNDLYQKVVKDLVNIDVRMEDDVYVANFEGNELVSYSLENVISSLLTM